MNWLSALNKSTVNHILRTSKIYLYFGELNQTFMSNLRGVRNVHKSNSLGVIHVRDLKMAEDDYVDCFDDQTDQFIWAAFKKGDEQSYVFIYEKYFASLINYGHQFTKDSQLLEDCIQDLFIDLNRNRANLTENNSSIKFYLFKSLKRRIIEARRKFDKEPVDHIEAHKDFEITLPVEALIIEKQVKEEQLVQLRQALKKLTGRQREVLYYLFYEELTYQEIQELMGLDHVRSVRNIFYKAITVLKSSFKLLFLFHLA